MAETEKRAPKSMDALVFPKPFKLRLWFVWETRQNALKHKLLLVTGSCIEFLITDSIYFRT